MTTTTEAPQTEEVRTPTQAPAPEQPRRSRRKLLLIGLAALVVAVALFFAIKALTGGDDPQTVKAGPADSPFRLSVPKGWRNLSEQELGALPGKPAAVIRREDGKGFVVVRREGRPPKSFQSFTKDLDKEFEKRVPDFQKRTTRTLKIKAGEAFFYSYIRKRAGTVHSVVLVPAQKGSYVLNTVAKGGEDEVAKELGRLIVSFDS